MRKRRPETRLNLQYDKLYVNNIAYVYNEDTEEVEILNQPEMETEYQVEWEEEKFKLKYQYCYPRQ